MMETYTCSSCKHRKDFSTSDRCHRCRALGYQKKIFYSSWEADGAPEPALVNTGPPDYTNLPDGHPDIDYAEMFKTLDGLLGDAIEKMEIISQIPAVDEVEIIDETLETLREMQTIVNPQPCKSETPEKGSMVDIVNRLKQIVADAEKNNGNA